MMSENLTPLRGLSLLLAEDEVGLREYMAGILEEYVGEVLVAGAGDEALDLFDRHPVHLALLDITMPGISGLEVAARIRERDADLPILILTSHRRTEFIREAVSLGLLDYLFNPLDINLLELALARCVEELRARGRLEIRLAGGALYNPTRGSVRFLDRVSQLTSQEKRFLDVLLRYRGAPLSVQRVSQELGCEGEFGPVALRNLVYRLRQKTGPQAVTSRRDTGYMAPPANGAP